MRAEVKRPFYDLKEDVARSEGQVFDLTHDRYRELDKKLKGFVVAIEDPKEDTDLTIEEIKAELDKMGVDYPAKAKKADLLKLLD